MTGLRTIAAFVCIMILMEAVTAAPVLDSNNTNPSARRTRSTKSWQLRKNERNLNVKKLRWVNLLNETDWTNACHSNGNLELTSEISAAILATSSANISEPKEVKTAIWDLNQTLSRFQAENTTEWTKFHSNNFTFLSTRPGHDPYRWHEQEQVFVASLSLILYMQEKKDKADNNATISNEIREIFNQAQELLCQIEHFINRTTNAQQTRHPKFISKEKMAGKINSLPKKDQIKISNAFVKERFTQFLEKLYKNVKNYNPDITPETRQQKNKRRRTRLPSRRPNCTPRPGKRCRKKRTTVEPNSEPTKPMFIVRTPKNPRKQKKPQRPFKTVQ